MNGYDENNDAREKATVETLWWWATAGAVGYRYKNRATAAENLARIKWPGCGRILQDMWTTLFFTHPTFITN
jgi:hypothetical protein